MTDFDEALSRAAGAGSVHAADEDLMAAFCKYDLQRIAGAVSPRLVWTGARKKGLTVKELTQLAGTDPWAVESLQWL